MASLYDAVGCRRFGEHGPNLLAPSSFFQVGPATVTPLVGVCLGLRPTTRCGVSSGSPRTSPANDRELFCTGADGFDGRSLRPTNAERQCNKPVLRRTSRLPSPPVRLTGDQSLTRRAVSTSWAPVANGGDRR